MTAHLTDPDLGWFFDALDSGPTDGDIESRLRSAAPEIAGPAAYLVLATGRNVPQSTLSAIADALAQELNGAANRPCPLWLLALWAAVLRLADRQAETAHHASLLARVKNHAYINYTRGGTLMADSHKSDLDYTIVLASVPFGLFEPEDLALVAAINEMTAAGRQMSADDRMMLAWYYSEQGSYAKSRALLGASPQARLGK